MNVKDYEKGLTSYSYSESQGLFKHSLNKDYQLFIIWQNGRDFESDILVNIEQNFEILSTVSIHWSENNIIQNFNRFYKAIDNPHINDKAEAMGKGEFLCIIVEDRNPEYQYRQTVSGNIELVNIRAVEVKRETRKICGGYYVHSSASPDEFFEQAILLFGEDLLQEILNLQHTKLTLQQDLKGANGWSEFSELFDILKYTSKYLVLRNFEYLPFDFFENDKDVDILCENSIDFISASNAKILSLTEGGAKVNVNIEGKEVPFDIRFIGDDYYDIKWAASMLEQRVMNLNNIYKPRLDDYFFSLLYHSVLQKQEIKPIYFKRFESLSNELQLDFFDIKQLNNNRYIASVLEGYFSFKRYTYTKPKDPEVYVNYSVLKYISKKFGGDNSRITYRLVKFIMPRKIIDYIPSSIKIKLHKIIS